MPAVCTGASVLALKYKDGVMVAADTLISYGSLARFKGMSRIQKLSESCLIAFSGDHSDFQHISEMLQEELYVLSIPSNSEIAIVSSMTVYPAPPPRSTRFSAVSCTTSAPR